MKLIIETDNLYQKVNETQEKIDDLNKKFDMIINCEEIKGQERIDMLEGILKERQYHMGYTMAIMDILSYLLNK